MDLAGLPQPLQGLAASVVPALRQVYDLNAERHDDLVGDDAMTFGFNIYRNSWFRLEQELGEHANWATSRPEGSLLISGSGYRVHVYRCGQDEAVDLDGFRLDDAGASLTKQDIARTNGQLKLALEETEPKPSENSGELRELVIVHAGNPDDGCCGVWIGAPLPVERVVGSPWEWVAALWLIERAEASAPGSAEPGLPVRHDELPEPDVEVKPVEDDESSTGEA